MPDEVKCPNCEEPVKKNWRTCPACHADLTMSKYSKSDDPIDKLSKKVDKIDEFLTEKFPPSGTPPPTDGKKKKTLFGSDQ